jgi:germination protein M
MRIPRLLRLLLVVAALAAGVAACGDDDEPTSTDTTAATDVTTTTEATDGTTSTTEHDEPDPAEDVPLSVYFLDADSKVRVGYVRTIDSSATGRGALEALLEGPNADDEALGLSTSIPEGTTLRSIDIAGGIATVDLSEEFTSGGGSLSMQARLAQIVYTVTQFPTVDEVEILVEGSVLEVLGGEGILIDGTLTRADFQFDSTYEWLEPMILVETPRPGEVIEGGSVDVGGTSNTFEAAVYIEVLDASGAVVVPETYTMATAGSGTTGAFLESIPLPEDLTGSFTVVAYDLSAEDGVGRLGVTEVPVSRG